jgi:tripartite-type tricarboxylate transporter receptor subunit TctC
MSEQHRCAVARRRLVLVAAAALGTYFTATAALAQSAFPIRPVRVVVPYPPGGPNDLIARLLTQRLSERLKQPFIVDNKPGATGLTGTESVAKSAPDGYTLLISASVHVIYASLFKKVSFDPLKDFAGITQLARTPLVLSVSPGFAAKSVKELVAQAKAHPGALQYASSGNGSATHLAAEAFKSQAGIDLFHVPYKGSSPAMTDVIAGHVPIVFDSLASTLPFVKSGKLRALAVTSAARSPAAPDLPTIAEAGVPGYDITTWYGLWAPAGTPKDIVDKLASEMQQVLKTPDMTRELSSRGIEAVGSTPAEFAAYEVAESAKWAHIVKVSGATLD